MRCVSKSITTKGSLLETGLRFQVWPQTVVLLSEWQLLLVRVTYYIHKPTLRSTNTLISIIRSFEGFRRPLLSDLSMKLKVRSWRHYLLHRGWGKRDTVENCIVVQTKICIQKKNTFPSKKQLNSNPCVKNCNMFVVLF